MTIDEFKEYNKKRNVNLQANENFKPILPAAEQIYYKDYHFLDEPLINRKGTANTNTQP